MSGICGLVDFAGAPVGAEVLARMALASQHRGPDGVHYHLRESVGFAHLALHATAESVQERQPLARRGVWLTADLRLDNRDEILRNLRNRGLAPEGREPGDGEIALGAYLLWGESCAERLLGDFAIAVWDGRIQRVLCICDPLGVKPLTYARAGALFCFASEAQQILQIPTVPQGLDEHALADHLTGCPQEPRRTFFQAIHRLPPAHRLLVTAGTVRMERYWRPGRNRVFLPPAESAACFHDLFERAVADRLRTSGGAVGITLSGGLDSSSVAAVAQRRLTLAGKAHGPLLGCSFIFDRLAECDERVYIRHLAEELGFEASWIDAENHWLLDDPASYVPALESPFVGWLSCHREALTNLRSRGARVVLTGNGGDDLLHGSSLVLIERLLHGDFWTLGEIWRYGATRDLARGRLLYRLLLRPLLPDRLEAGLRRLIRRELPSPMPDWIDPQLARRTNLAARLATRRRFAGGRNAARRDLLELAVERAAYQRAIHWHDRLAASFGIEVRHPFLDRRLFDFVLSLPSEQLFQLGCYKPLLRHAMEGVLPDVLRLRSEKVRLGGYVDLSLREKAVGTVEDLLREPIIAELGFVNGDRLRAAFQEYRTGTPNEAQRALWFAVTLELWLQRQYNGSELLLNRGPALAGRSRAA